jgi:hypothetical protein
MTLSDSTATTEAIADASESDPTFSAKVQASGPWVLHLDKSKNGRWARGSVDGWNQWGGKVPKDGSSRIVEEKKPSVDSVQSPKNMLEINAGVKETGTVTVLEMESARKVDVDVGKVDAESDGDSHLAKEISHLELSLGGSSGAPKPSLSARLDEINAEERENAKHRAMRREYRWVKAVSAFAFGILVAGVLSFVPSHALTIFFVLTGFFLASFLMPWYRCSNGGCRIALEVITLVFCISAFLALAFLDGVKDKVV